MLVISNLVNIITSVVIMQYIFLIILQFTRTKNVPWHIPAPAAVACDIRIVLRRSALLSVLQPFELLVYLMLLSLYLHVSSECNLFLFLKIIYNSVHVSECHAYNLRTYLIVVGI